MHTYKGIDVSTFQGKIDWTRVKADGIDFAMLRASYGWENQEQQTDARFHENVQSASEAGILLGVYHYSYATTPDEAHREAEFFLNIIRDYAFAYPVAYDVEDRVQANLGRERISEIAQTWCDDMRRAEYYPMIYTNLDWVRNRFTPEVLRDNDLWLAQYNNVPTYDGPIGIWQYTSGGIVSGIRGKVDRDTSYKEYPVIIRDRGLNGFKKPPETQPDGDSSMDRVVVVEPGDTLSGIAQRYSMSWEQLYTYNGNREVIGDNPNWIRPGMALHIPAEDYHKPILRVGELVRYSGRLYGDSYGGSPGATVSGVFTITRIINGRKCGVLLDNMGWVPADKVYIEKEF